MIDAKDFFDQPINSDLKTYENIRKIAIGQGNDYTTGCLLDLLLFQRKLQNTIDLSKQVLNADPTAIQQINFTENLDRAGDAIMFFIEESRETVLDFW